MSKYLLLSHDGAGLPLASLLSQAGHTVAAFIEEEKAKRQYDGLLPKVTEWDSSLSKETIVLFDSVGFGLKEDEKPQEEAEWDDYVSIGDELRAQGYLVVGGSSIADRMELDRTWGAKLAKEAGLLVPKSTRVDTFKDAKKLVESTKLRYILKPHGNQAVFNVYPAEEWRDMAALLDHYDRVKDRKKDGKPVIEEGPMELQEFIEGPQLSTEGFWNGSEFVSSNSTFEAKPMLDEDLGVYTGETGSVIFFYPSEETTKLQKDVLLKLEATLKRLEYPPGPLDINCIVNEDGAHFLEFTCYSEDTEILTQHGWKLIRDVQVGETVATLNPSTHQLEYQLVQGTIAKRFDGEMVRISGNGTAHAALDALVTPDHSMYVRHRDKWKFERADSLSSHGVNIKRTALWQGEEPSTYTIPAYIEQHFNGRQKYYYPLVHPAITMPMEAWLQFLGIYLAEGSIGGPNRSHVSISQYSKVQEVQALLKEFPLSVKRSHKGFQISSIQLAHHLEPALAFQKRVPAYVKTLCPRLIRIFLEAFRIGDGSVNKRTNQVSYYTTSKVLADDVQELLLKCGSLGNIRHFPVSGSTMHIKGRKPYVRRHDGYRIAERVVKQDYHVDRRNISRVAYSGNVYCVEVPNHLLFVRRNGNPFWCGNCRFGYPACYIEAHAIEDDLGEAFDQLARGTFHGFTVKPFHWFMGARVWLPRWPFGEVEPQFIDAPLLTRLTDEAKVYTHLVDVYEQEGQLRVAGADGELCCVTAEGNSIVEARGKLYQRLNELYLYPMGWRSDLGMRVLDNLANLERWGYWVPAER